MKTKPRCIVAPSLLSANFSRVGEDVLEIGKTSAQWIHLDVMDGHFVPNITFGPKFISDIRPLTPLVLDTHLMIEHPDRYVTHFAKAGSDIITVHSEAAVHLHRVLQAIHDEGKQAGVSIVPSTPVASLEIILSDVELVLVMSVDPGFGGQKFIPSALEKIRQLAEIRQTNRLNYRIAVDGGVNETTFRQILDAKADVLVVGSAFFGAKDKQKLVSLMQGQE